MKKLFKDLEYYFGTVRGLHGARYKYAYCADEPEFVAYHTIYLVGERKNIWLIAFRCPCGCNDVVRLNTLLKASPCWRYFIRWGRISISPSIWRRVGCKSHFHIRKGRVQWSYI